MGITDALGLDLNSVTNIVLLLVVAAVACAGFYWNMHYRMKEIMKTMASHEDRCVVIQGEIKDELHEMREAMERGFQRNDEKQSKIHDRVNRIDEDVHYLKGKLDK